MTKKHVYEVTVGSDMEGDACLCLTKDGGYYVDQEEMQELAYEIEYFLNK